MFTLIEKKLSPLFAGVPSGETVSWNHPCDCCGRQAVLFNKQAIVFLGSGQTQALCQACYFFVQPNERMGYEIKTTPYRLNSFKDGFLVLPTNDEPCEIWLGGNYVTRFQNNEHLICKPVSGHAAKLELLADRREKLVIWLSPRRELFLRNLRLSNQNHLFVASEEGCLEVELAVFHQLEALFDEMEKKKKNNLISLLSLFKKGLIAWDNAKLQAALTELDDHALSVIAKANNNPVGFIFMLEALKAKESKK